MGQKLSIVSHKPQTTRHRIVGIASARKFTTVRRRGRSRYGYAFFILAPRPPMYSNLPDPHPFIPRCTAAYQMILFDTPGIIETKRNKLEERMMSAVVSSIQVWISVDTSFMLTPPCEWGCLVWASIPAFLDCCLIPHPPPPRPCKNSEAIVAVVDSSLDPKGALAMFQVGGWRLVRLGRWMLD